MASRTTSFSLGTELDEFVREQVESGAYTSASEVVRKALQQMAQEQRKEQALLKALDHGVTSGRARPGTWKRVQAEVRKRARAKR
jgi:antitoxin ParD1/3/4